MVGKMPSLLLKLKACAPTRQVIKAVIVVEDSALVPKLLEPNKVQLQKKY
jgi:hypothetical protein